MADRHSALINVASDHQHPLYRWHLALQLPSGSLMRAWVRAVEQGGRASQSTARFCILNDVEEWQLTACATTMLHLVARQAWSQQGWQQLSALGCAACTREPGDALCGP
jgi:hypothetical protein